VILKSPVIRTSLHATTLSASYLTAVGATKFSMINAGVNLCLKLSMFDVIGN